MHTGMQCSAALPCFCPTRRTISDPIHGERCTASSFARGFSVTDEARRAAKSYHAKLCKPARAVPLADYGAAAAQLFDNMRAPAALIGGAIVPMGFAATPEYENDDSDFIKRLKQLHMWIAILSLTSEILAVVQSTVAINKLSETAVPKAASVSALLRDHLELQWLGTNIHFLLGSLGFSLLLGLRAWFVLGPDMGKAGLLASFAVISQALSIINHGISTGDGSGNSFGSNFGSIIVRYAVLQIHNIAQTQGILQVASIFLLAASIIFFLRARVSSNEH